MSRGNVEDSAAQLAADVAEAHGLHGNQQADLTNDLLASVDDFVAQLPAGRQDVRGWMESEDDDGHDTPQMVNGMQVGP